LYAIYQKVHFKSDVSLFFPTETAEIPGHSVASFSSDQPFNPWNQQKPSAADRLVYDWNPCMFEFGVCDDTTATDSRVGIRHKGFGKRQEGST
jgi:hypothetical protein